MGLAAFFWLGAGLVDPSGGVVAPAADARQLCSTFGQSTRAASLSQVESSAGQPFHLMRYSMRGLDVFAEEEEVGA